MKDNFLKQTLSYKRKVIENEYTKERIIEDCIMS